MINVTRAANIVDPNTRPHPKSSATLWTKTENTANQNSGQNTKGSENAALSIQMINPNIPNSPNTFL